MMPCGLFCGIETVAADPRSANSEWAPRTQCMERWRSAARTPAMQCSSSPPVSVPPENVAELRRVLTDYQTAKQCR